MRSLIVVGCAVLALAACSPGKSSDAGGNVASQPQAGFMGVVGATDPARYGGKPAAPGEEVAIKLPVADPIFTNVKVGTFAPGPHQGEIGTLNADSGKVLSPMLVATYRRAFDNLKARYGEPLQSVNHISDKSPNQPIRADDLNATFGPKPETGIRTIMLGAETDHNNPDFGSVMLIVLFDPPKA